MINYQRPKDVLKKWAEAFNTRNAEAGAALYHEDAESVQIAFGVPLIGREAILNDFKQFFKHNPDNETHIVSLFEEGEWAIIEWSGNATFYETPGAVGKPYQLRGCGFFQVIEGKIKQQRGYFDKATWFRQIGAPIP